MNALQALALAKGYTAATIKGAGAIKGKDGKNCKIKSIEKIGKQHKVTFEWTDDDGTTRTDYILVEDGSGGATEISKEKDNAIESKSDGLYVKKTDENVIKQVGVNKTAIEVLNGDAETEGSVDKKISSAISTLNKLEKKIFDHIPTPAEVKDNVLYLVPTEKDNTYNQYMLIDGEVANLGSTEIDLDDYAKLEDVVKLQQQIIDKGKVLSVGEDGKVTLLADKVGDLSELKTEDKHNVVEAVNEVLEFAELAGGSGIDYYSTEERLIGRWIDGKKIYRRVISINANIVIKSSAWADVYTESWVGTIKTIVNSMAMRTESQAGSAYNHPLLMRKLGSTISLRSDSVEKRVDTIILEYTKNTD